MKKMIALVLALVLALSLVACGGAASSEAASAPAAGGEVADLTEAIFEGPILLTTAGQSADYQMIGSVLKNLGMDYSTDALAETVNGAKTLIVVVGGSSKGLGAAGIDADGELARVNALIADAEANGCQILAMHTGGAARRGELSDKFITPVFEKADYCVVVEAGDTDGLMAGVCSANSIPCGIIASISDVTTTLPAAFK